ncbi:hypothetical protein FXO38_14710 [Capsicum annuum]|nr:hypothetical protein FXO38_14710 [Capsicum annuum]
MKQNMKYNCNILLVTFPSQGQINPSLQFAKCLIKLGVNAAFSTSVSAMNSMSNCPSIEGLTFTPFSDGYDNGYPNVTTSLHKYREFYASFIALGSGVDLFLQRDIIFSPIASPCFPCWALRLIVHTLDVQSWCVGFVGVPHRWDKGRPWSPWTILSSMPSLRATEGRPFSRIIYTSILSWVRIVAKKINAPATLLWIQPATQLDIYYYYFNNCIFAIKNCILDNQPIELPGLPFLVEYGLELEALRAIKNVTMVGIGPLVPSYFLDGEDTLDTCYGGDLTCCSKGYMDWLDSSRNGSIVYVAFGSYSELSNQMMEEIAKGLVKSKRPFLWVIRDGGKSLETLSFKEELGKQGKIVLVLSCGGFTTSFFRLFSDTLWMELDSGELSLWNSYRCMSTLDRPGLQF